MTDIKGWVLPDGRPFWSKSGHSTPDSPVLITTDWADEWLAQGTAWFWVRAYLVTGLVVAEDASHTELCRMNTGSLPKSRDELANWVRMAVALGERHD